MKRSVDLTRVGSLLMGMYLMGVGTALALFSALSGDAVAYLWQACAQQSGISIESVNAIFTLLLLIIIIMFDITKLGIGTIICPFIQNFGIWTTNLIISNNLVPSPLISILMGLLGIIVLSIGCGIFAYANLGMSAYLGLGKIVNEKFSINYGLVIVGADSVCFILASIISRSIMIGPLIATLVSGPIIDWTMKSIYAFDKSRKVNHYENNISL